MAAHEFYARWLMPYPKTADIHILKLAKIFAAQPYLVTIIAQKNLGTWVCLWIVAALSAMATGDPFLYALHYSGVAILLADLSLTIFTTWRYMRWAKYTSSAPVRDLLEKLRIKADHSEDEKIFMMIYIYAYERSEELKRKHKERHG